MSSRWLAAGALVGAAMLLRSSSAVGSTSPGRTVLNATSLRLMARPVERLLRQPGLADFLAATAYTESRFNTRATNHLGFRGLFQMTASTSRVADAGGDANSLYSPRWSIALVAWYISRLRSYAAHGQVIDWLAVRRGMAYPYLVADVGEHEERSRAVRDRFEQGLRAVGLHLSFAHQRAFPPGYNWPGIAAVMSAVGVGGVA